MTLALTLPVDDYLARLEAEERFAKVIAYNDSLNTQEIAPNGDDYNELLDILAGRNVDLPKPTGR